MQIQLKIKWQVYGKSLHQDGWIRHSFVERAILTLRTAHIHHSHMIQWAHQHLVAFPFLTFRYKQTETENYAHLQNLNMFIHSTHFQRNCLLFGKIKNKKINKYMTHRQRRATDAEKAKLTPNTSSIDHFAISCSVSLICCSFHKVYGLFSVSLSFFLSLCPLFVPCWDWVSVSIGQESILHFSLRQRGAVRWAGVRWAQFSAIMRENYIINVNLSQFMLAAEYFAPFIQPNMSRNPIPPQSLSRSQLNPRA